MRNGLIVFGVTVILVILGVQAKGGATRPGDFIAGGVLLFFAGIEAVILILGNIEWEREGRRLQSFRHDAEKQAKLKTKPTKPYGR